MIGRVGVVLQGEVGRSVGGWSAATVHDTVAAIARQRAYAMPLRQSLLGRFAGYVIERIADLLALLRGSGNGRVLVVATVALIVVVVSARILATRSIDAAQRRAAGMGLRRREAIRTDLWSVANELAAAGDYAAACHALYAAVLDELARTGAVQLHSSKTSGDYARELRRRGSPATRDFRAFARQFDRVIYGRAAPSADGTAVPDSGENVSAEDFARLAQAATQATRAQAAA